MKKNLLFSFLILFVLNTVAFAGLTDPGKRSENPVSKDPKENRLSDEEISRLSKRAEINNLSNPSFSNKEKDDSRNSLKPPNQAKGEQRHPVYVIGGLTLVLLIILIIVLV